MTKVYLWNIEEPNKAFTPVDIKPDKIEEVDEVITFSKYHPVSDSLFVYGTSKGNLRMADMRQAGIILANEAICDNNAVSFKYESTVARNFFTDIVSSYNSGTFTANERYLVARDFLSVKVWDVAMPNKPVSVVTVQESLKSKLYEMFDNEHISDSFSISAGKDSRTLLTGNFNSNFHLIDLMEGVTHQPNIDQHPIRTQLQPQDRKPANDRQDGTPGNDGLRPQHKPEPIQPEGRYGSHRQSQLFLYI